MQMLREIAPFLVGLALPPVVMLAIRQNWSGRQKFAAVFGPALALGVVTSFLAGELAGGLGDGAIAMLIDTALVFTASQLAYRLFWKVTLEPRLRREEGPLAPERVRRR